MPFKEDFIPEFSIHGQNVTKKFQDLEELGLKV